MLHDLLFIVPRIIKIKFINHTQHKTIIWRFLKQNMYIYITTENTASVEKIDDIPTLEKLLCQHLLQEKGTLRVKYNNYMKVDEYTFV